MKKKRVVAYVRVSSASKAQLHSYEFQEEYWRNKFAEDQDYELVTTYADRGISGCSMHRRPQFLAMMQDARAGRFDVIYTKSVSRFARNTVELLQAVRELRDMGIEVIFEKEQISTLQPTSELFLTIAASIAENDLEVDSQRQKWSFQRRFENGWYSIGSGMYGYRMTGDNHLTIVPEEAEVVRWIYDMYLSGCGCPTIADTLNKARIPNSKGNPWRPNTILKLISNEKYMGDAMMGKSVNIDGRKCDNMDGQYGERFYIEDAHEAIVSKETFYRAQEQRQRRANPKLVKQAHPSYPFTGMIVCGCCGSSFRHKVNNSGKKWRNDIWVCARKERDGKATCESTRIKDTVLREKFIEAYNEFVTQRPQGDAVAKLQSEILTLQKQEQEIATLMLGKLISEKDFRIEQQS
jgi:site-specific DNA recombinase